MDWGRKITSHLARIKKGLAHELPLGNLEAKRDWGHSKDYVRAMWMMLQMDSPDNYVIGTGESHSVREFAQIAFECVGLDYKNFLVSVPQYYRPAEIYDLVADASKAQAKLGWKRKYQFIDMVREMVEYDLQCLG